MQVAEELGVRYVLEGSVRRAGDTVRINTRINALFLRSNARPSLSPVTAWGRSRPWVLLPIGPQGRRGKGVMVCRWIHRSIDPFSRPTWVGSSSFRMSAGCSGTMNVVQPEYLRSRF